MKTKLPYAGALAAITIAAACSAKAQLVFTPLKMLNHSTGIATGVVEGSDELLYGTIEMLYDIEFIVLSPAKLFRINKNGSGYEAFHQFALDEYAYALMQGSDGLLYGMSSAGLYRISRDGSGYVVLAPDGTSPTEASDGRLYVAALHGGSSNYGFLYGINKDGTGYRVLHSFDGVNDDGLGSVQLAEGSNGSLYGASTRSGAFLYRINKDGTGYTVTRRWSRKGIGPSIPEIRHPLIEINNRWLYGWFRVYSGGPDFASIFRLQKDGTDYTEVFTLTNAVFDGPIREGSDGALYGNGAFGVEGTVGYSNFLFRVSTDGSGFTILRSETNYLAADSYAHLWVRASDGSFYGTSASSAVGATDPGIPINPRNGTIFRFGLPELHLATARIGNALQFTATGTTNTQWRLESRDTWTGSNAWQPLTNITLGSSPVVLQQPLGATDRFYRAAWVP